MFRQDFRHALRALLKSPGFTAIAVVALALGIGVNTAVFSVAEAFLLRPLPFHDLDRLAVVLELPPHETVDTSSVALATFLDWQAQSRSFESWGGFQWNDVNLSTAGSAQKVQGFNVTANFFDVLDARPALGRTLQAGENQPGHDREVILSHGLWVRSFGGDPKVIGTTVRLDSMPYTVIGVMPKEFDFPLSAELWMPLALDAKARSDRTRRYAMLPIARMKPGVSFEQAAGEMRGIAQQISERFPETNRGWSVRVMSMRLFAIGDLTQQYTLLLLGAVGFVLLIVCANVANLQFARASHRDQEIAVRVAMGARRRDIVRLLLTESVLLGLAGALPGLLLAGWALNLILSAMPPDVAKFIGGWDQIRLDGDALSFTLFIAVLAGITAGLAPALKGSRPDLERALKESGRGSSSSRTTHRLRSALVVSQVSLALVLMIGAGLMGKGFSNLLRVHQRLEPGSILTMHASLPESDRYKTPQQVSAFYDEALRQFATIPQVRSATVLTSPPFSQNYSTRSIEIEGREAAASGEQPIAYYQAVSPDFFPMMDVPLRDGRLFDSRDRIGAPQAVIVSENIARRYWPAESALGRRLRLGPAGSESPALTIVGVVGDVHLDWEHSAPEQVVYLPYSQAARHWGSFALQVSGDPKQISETVRRRMAAIDPDLPLYDVKTLRQVIHESTVGLAYVAVMLGVVGLLGLILSAVGVYGVMAYAVAERTHEFGIRMALGAAPGEVLRLVVLRGARLTLTGLAIGLPAGLALAQLLAGLVFGVSAGDMPTFAATALLLCAVAGLACYLPAQRAARTDPIVALRHE